jgi:hypothetical protein
LSVSFVRFRAPLHLFRKASRSATGAWRSVAQRKDTDRAVVAARGEIAIESRLSKRTYVTE